MTSNMRDLLRSDHAPFWRQGIPGVFLTDTAEFRYPYYHTPADLIDKVDFDFLAKMCKAIVATITSLKSA
jgi:Zn-dependent M28 family amino/carboxypeptidase